MTEATFTVKVNIRQAASASSADIGDLYVGDRVYGAVVGGWINFSKVYRADGGIVEFGSSYAAVQDPTNSAVKYAMLKDVAEPTPNPDPVPTVKPLIVTIEGDGYETVVVTVNPKS